MICKNCAAEVHGKYCSECGQKASTKRFDLKFVFSELIDKLLPLDKGVLFTTRQLLTTPGTSMREYLAGKRMNYTKPLSYSLLVFGISLIFFSMQDFQQGMQEGMGADANEKTRAAQVKIAEMLSSNITLMYATLIPFLALATKWFFRKSGLNYAEFLVISTYYTAGSVVAGLPIMAWAKIYKNNHYVGSAMAALALLYMGYLVWAYLHFFHLIPRWKVLLKTIGVSLISYALYILFVGFVTAIVLLAYQ